jgi:hypothetical protein
MENNEAAFPSSPCLGRYDPEWGLTKRELIAAMAMQGILSRSGGHSSIVSEFALRHADALIKRLAADPVAEGVNLLPMYSRELDEGLDNDQDRGVSR